MSEHGSIMTAYAPTDGSFTDSLRNELRREQLAVEAAPLLMELFHSTPSIELYGEVLRRWYRVVSAIQPGSDRALGQRSPEMGWLESDLSRLGIPPCARWNETPEFGPAESLGYRFAIETQHLRSRVVLPMLRHELADQTEAFDFFEAHGGQTKSWRRTVSQIDQVEPTLRRDVLVGARATLTALDRAFAG